MVIQLNLVRGINTILDLLSDEMGGGPAPPTVDSDVSDDEEGRFSPGPNSAHFSGKHRLLKLRLAPLRTVQRDLEVRIGIQAGADFNDTMISPPGSPVLGGSSRKQEFFVRSATSWKHSRTGSDDAGGRRSKEVQMRETADILAGCADDMKAIWEDPTIRDMLLRKGLRMETTPGLCVVPPPLVLVCLFGCMLTRVQLLE